MIHPPFSRPAVGVAVIIVQSGKVLLGKRLNAHGAGTWAFPGGHLEGGESIAACAKREVLEETGMAVSQVRPLAFTNDIFEAEGKHYITLFVSARINADRPDKTRPEVREPHKCEKWEWFDWGSLPRPRFLSLENFLGLQINPTKPAVFRD